MRDIHKFISVSVLLVYVLLSSCKEDTPQDQISRMGISYFSVSQYLFDQWKNYNGHPFTVLKTEKTGDKIDSTYINSEKFDWSGLISIFLETDISDHDLVGHYKFIQYEDKNDNTINFFYQAIDDNSDFFGFFDRYQNLLTRKLLVSADVNTNHIRRINIETYNHSMLFGDTNQKLFYVPFKTIQIQKYEKPMFGAKKSTITQYFFVH